MLPCRSRLVYMTYVPDGPYVPESPQSLAGRMYSQVDQTRNQVCNWWDLRLPAWHARVPFMLTLGHACHICGFDTKNLRAFIVDKIGQGNLNSPSSSGTTKGRFSVLSYGR